MLLVRSLVEYVRITLTLYSSSKYSVYDVTSVESNAEALPPLIHSVYLWVGLLLISLRVHSYMYVGAPALIKGIRIKSLHFIISRESE